MEVQEGKILWIDLSSSSFSYESYSNYEKYLGGRGINQYVILKEIPEGTSPFEPRNIIGIGAGILTGTKIPGASRLNVDAISPVTGGIGSGNCGGYFAAELRKAGITNIFISGKSRSLSYLLIENGENRIVKDEKLKGKTTIETTNILKHRHGGAEVLCIGPAGENLVRSACIIASGARAVGRCGLGAVMGSKNLKAVVVKGSKKIEPCDKERLNSIIDRSKEKLLENDFNQKRMKYGVFCYPPWEVESPYRNFSGEVPPQEKKVNLSPDKFFKMKKSQKSCSACPIGCWGLYEFKYQGEKYHVEALQGNDPNDFGARLDFPDAKSVLVAHKLCNDLGLDVDNISCVIAWTIEIFKKGYLNQEDVDGLELEWGKTQNIFRLIRKIAYRDGIGEILAEGCKRASKRIAEETERFCINVKDQELYESLWVSPSWALGTMVSPRGGTHTRGAVLEERLQSANPADLLNNFGIPYVGKTVDYANKEKLVCYFERLQAFLDSVGICMFTNSLRLDMLQMEDYVRLFNAATGKCFSKGDILLSGERIHNIEKAFNVFHTNWGRTEDIPPDRFFKTALNGQYKLDKSKWSKMLNRYYQMHGWDSDGKPTAQTLDAIGLDEIIEKLGDNIKLE